MPTPTLRATIALTLSALLTACLYTSGHKVFLHNMQFEVGKSADDPYSYRNLYRRRLLSAKDLPNGNLEEEFPDGRRERCRVFFEIDKVARKIVSWRYEGTEDDCATTP